MAKKKFFWIHLLKNEAYRSKLVNIDIFSKILANFKKLFISVAEINEFITEEYQRETYVPFFYPYPKKGSIAFGIKLNPPSYNKPLFEKDHYAQTTEMVKEILQKFDSDDDYSYFKNKFPQNRNRVSILKIGKELNFYYGPEYMISYSEFKNDELVNQEFKIKQNKEKRKRIHNWITEKESIEEIPYVDGRFNGFKASSNVFWIIDEKGKEINCEYEDDFRDLPSPTSENAIYRVYGDYTEIPGRKPSITNIIRVELIGFENILHSLRKEHKSKIFDILNLEEGWYYGNSKSFKQNTIDNAFLYYSKINYFLKNEYNKSLVKPMLFPGPEGKIILEWSNEKLFLQIIVPESKKMHIKIYGKNKINNKSIIKYYRLFQVKDELISWLSQQI